jgi:hypothetical protein
MPNKFINLRGTGSKPQREDSKKATPRGKCTGVPEDDRFHETDRLRLRAFDHKRGRFQGRI